MKGFKRFTALTISALLILLSQGMFLAANAASDPVAHWVFQNAPQFMSGDIDGKDFTIKDVSGNGNDLIVASQTTGTISADARFLKWAPDGYNGGASSLLFNNQKSYIDAEQTDSFVNIVPSGKWMETIGSAAMNALTFEKGFTFEVLFKVDPGYDASYNRYGNLFGRQNTALGLTGTNSGDPLFGLAVAGNEGDVQISNDTPCATQFVQLGTDETTFTNTTGPNEIKPGEWYHIAVVNDGSVSKMHVNGVEVASIEQTGIANGGFGWDVGARRNFNDKTDSALGNPPKGELRRLFCGQIAEIKISDTALTADKFIHTAKTDVSTFAPKEEPAPEPAEAAAQAAEPEKNSSTAEQKNPVTGDFGIVTYALVFSSAILMLIISKKKSRAAK